MATGSAAALRRKCSACGDQFIGGPRAVYCSPACRKRAQRARGGNKRDPKRDTSAVTVRIAATADDGHCAEAAALLDALDRELAAVGAERGQTLVWSAQDEAIRELIACAVDREMWLRATCSSSDDVKLQMKAATELRLTEAHRARLIRQIKTVLPEPESFHTRKARRAARARWDRDA